METLRQKGGDRGRVLVVDDSQVVRFIVCQCLREAGFVVDEADNGGTALARAGTGAYDVLVTDLRMPIHDGFELVEKIKASGLLTEVIILTGEHKEDRNSAVRALRLGAHDYVTKPPRPEEIVITVDRAVEKKRLREANTRLLRELAELSRTDGLTGAANRRSFDEALGDEAARALRYKLPLSLVMFDLDHFKGVNDRYGHPTGDAVLRHFATVAKSALRSVDSLYRYGGEEFAALLPHTTAAGALIVAVRVVDAVATTPLKAEALTLHVTVSAGVASASAAAPVYDSLVAQADAALYTAKQSGRNCAVGASADRRAAPLRAVRARAWTSEGRAPSRLSAALPPGRSSRLLVRTRPRAGTQARAASAR